MYKNVKNSAVIYFNETWYEGVKLDPKGLQKFLLKTDTRWRNY